MCRWGIYLLDDFFPIEKIMWEFSSRTRDGGGGGVRSGNLPTGLLLIGIFLPGTCGGNLTPVIMSCGIFLPRRKYMLPFPYLFIHSRLFITHFLKDLNPDSLYQNEYIYLLHIMPHLYYFYPESPY